MGIILRKILVRNIQIVFFFLLWNCSISVFGQTKSTVIQNINGVNYYIHKIEKQQSLYSISKLYNVSLDDIYLVNPETKGGTKAGQEIKIPVKAQSPATGNAGVKSNSIVPASNMPIDTTKYRVYKVAKGETLYAVSKKFNVSEVELKIWNPSLLQGLKEEQLIIVGEKKKGTVINNSSTSRDSVNPNVIHRPKKNEYTAALLLPFKLDYSLNLDLGQLLKSNSNFPAVPALAVDFYLGFKAATDSINKSDFKVNIDLYDISDKDTSRLNKTVNDPEFKKADFIFGPLYANEFKTVSQKAKQQGIPIVSPITQQNKMLFNNVYASKTNPSQFTLLESLADYCVDSLLVNGANIILVTPGSVDAQEISYVKSFKSYFNEKQRTLGKFPKDSIRIVKGLAGVKAAYVPNLKNIIVTLSNNQVFIADFTTQLAIYADKKDFTLCGWEKISKIDNLDQEYLEQLHFTFPTQNNSVNTSAYGAVIEQYKEKQNTLPGEYFFIGYDIATYYLKNLRDKGPDFIFELDKLPAETNYMRFKFVRPDNVTGFDNRGVYIFRYSNYQLQKTGWK